jgi:O-methyltransferase involved in polyketide biosynthesis
VPYLTRAEVAATVASVTARSAPGSRLIVNYQAPSLLGDLTRKVIGVVVRRASPWAAEPWRSAWTPAAMSRLLATHGFAVRRDHDLLVTATALGVRPNQATSLRNGRVALADH